VRVNVPVPVPLAFVAVSVMVKLPGLVGMPEMFPVLALRNKPWGSVLEPKLVGLWFVFGVKDHWAPAVIDLVILLGVKFGACPATSMISLSSEGYFATNLRVDLRV